MTERLVAGRYRLEGLLGRGGMGVVWQATDELIGRLVAVKELRVPPGLSDRERSTFGERALREARTAGRLSHPGIVAIHDLVPATAQDDAVYIVMELVKAPSLAEVLQRNGALSEERVTAVARQLIAALQAAHSIGLVHRDVKPSNIMMLPGDEVKLLDFGIAHAVDDTRLTRHGVAGSTGYMAPELFEGADPAPAADAWALGVTLHHAVVGDAPFARTTTAATLRAILHEDLPPSHSSPPLSTLITALLIRDPTRRMTVEQAGAFLHAKTPTTPPGHRTRTDRQDPTTTFGPTTTPPRTPPTAPTHSRQAPWADQPTTVAPDSVEVRCNHRPIMRNAAMVPLVAGLAVSLATLLLIGPTNASGVAGAVMPGLAISLIGVILPWVRLESLVRVTRSGLAFQRRKERWSANWDQVQRISVEPGHHERQPLWLIRVTLRRSAEPAVPVAFRVIEGTSTLDQLFTEPEEASRAGEVIAGTYLLFATHEQARSELARLHTFLRDRVSVDYQPHDDLVAML
ncbi:serine/threonine-protein kinase [Streptomyces sp. NPDC060232]|uniref:serine/threonine-protein kinase n=1 Tax=Streptomyces sp. NPDC060232 TaxID=3347079 RepID=UPI0036552E8B